MKLEALLQSRRILVCAGSGGVGKTTLAAVLGLTAARLGRKVLVCTIDPAKRLAASLGLPQLGNEERRVPQQHLDRLGLPIPGELWAMMLDPKRTFDALIERFAPSDEVRDRVLQNHFYQSISSQLAGSQEYMAMEKLHEIHARGDYDLLVFDTPPTQHALDFIDAPRRMESFLSGRALRWFLNPSLKASRLTLGLVRRGTGKVANWLDQMFGLSFLQDVTEFFQAFQGLYEGFQQRAARVQELLKDPQLAAFLLITSPLPFTVEEAHFFHQRLQELSLPFCGMVVNRVHPSCLSEGVEEPLKQAALGENAAQATLEDRWRQAGGDPALMAEALNTLRRAEILAASDREVLARLRTRMEAGQLFLQIPRFSQDVYDMGGLLRLGRVLAPTVWGHGSARAANVLL